jgi:hypothetical protein
MVPPPHHTVTRAKKGEREPLDLFPVYTQWRRHSPSLYVCVCSQKKKGRNNHNEPPRRKEIRRPAICSASRLFRARAAAAAIPNNVHT